jgi:RND family efflux transporter MFP subunit
LYVLVAGLPCWGAILAVAQEGTPTVLVETSKVQEKAFDETLTVYGRVQADPKSEVSVSVPQPGLIKRLFVRTGDPVIQGQPLAEFETAPIARFSFQQAQNALDLAKAEAGRAEELAQKAIIPASQLDIARQKLADARARFDEEKQLGGEAATIALNSPHEGIVSQVVVSLGDRVAADKAIATVASADHLVVMLGLEPEDAARVKSGLSVHLDAVFDEPVSKTATISAVGRVINPATRLVDAIATMPDDKVSQLMIGTIVTANVVLGSHTSLVVPMSAVLKDATGDHVFVVQAGKAKRVPVVSGLPAGEKLIAVTGSLSKGDEVVSVGNFELSDGAAVRTQP